MRNFMIKLAAATFVAAVSVPVMAAPSGSSGVSGSAGLGIDYAALVVTSGTGNPGMAVPGSSANGTMGGPIAGLIKQFSKQERTK